MHDYVVSSSYEQFLLDLCFIKADILPSAGTMGSSTEWKVEEIWEGIRGNQSFEKVFKLF